MQPEGRGRRSNGGGSCSLMISENSPVMPPTQWTFGDPWVSTWRFLIIFHLFTILDTQLLSALSLDGKTDWVFQSKNGAFLLREENVR
jgi:hypothetical protein